ncbi:hypothetical protein Salat_2553000 [Sesamum alatum]|uniref:Transmembrane protein n=1 Tax=Sesamum alatum TaxID=300844 RepID=A0AAE2CCN4_9LAMI|nr:hypothetical protein Salat_2553000 [Sesamum alatum]
MVEFGDELIIESYRIPWLIWIQLVVMILLILLLFFGFTVFTSDSSTSSAAASPPTAPPTHLNNPTSSNRIIKVEERSGRREAGAREGLIREDDDPGGDESCIKESMFLRVFGHPHHPCNYIGLAKRALFKCFGLDSSSDSSSSNLQHEKRE